jgi:hypothetical protein
MKKIKKISFTTGGKICEAEVGKEISHLLMEE